MNIEDIEALVKPLVATHIGGSLVREIAVKVWDNLKDRWILDEAAKATLREFQDHCRANIALVDRLLSQ